MDNFDYIKYLKNNPLLQEIKIHSPGALNVEYNWEEEYYRIHNHYNVGAIYYGTLDGNKIMYFYEDDEFEYVKKRLKYSVDFYKNNNIKYTLLKEGEDFYIVFLQFDKFRFKSDEDPIEISEKTNNPIINWNSNELIPYSLD